MKKKHLTSLQTLEQQPLHHFTASPILSPFAQSPLSGDSENIIWWEGKELWLAHLYDSQRDIHMKNLHNRTKKKKKQENINIPETNISIKQPEVPFVILYNNGDLPCPESSMVHRCEFVWRQAHPSVNSFPIFFLPILFSILISLFLFSSDQNL